MALKYNEELERGYTARTVMEEAERCLLCHDAPCSAACPAGTDPGSFIRSVRFRNFKGAAETIRENNALGAVCARVCPTEKYCQMACSRCGIDRPINIGGIQRFVTDFEEAAKMDILEAGAPNGKSAAIVGSGPSAIQAAATLLSLGYSVDIYERREKAGGYLRYGIPEYRLPDQVVDCEIARIEKLGAKIHCGVTIGEDITVEDLKKDHDAVLIAAGFSGAKTLPLFDGNPYAETAVSFLSRTKEKKGQVSVEKNVLVIGGGDVAMDVVTTLKLLGVDNVTDVVYEEFKEFLASDKELKGAQAMGVSIIDGYVPEKAEGNEVTFRHRRIPGELKLKADKIILAVGQKAETEKLGLTTMKNEVTFDGYQTEDSKVFVTGDLAHGDKTVVWAVRKGREAAQAIHQAIGGAKA